jgi:SAM-dependent methyltransferase
MQSDVIDIETSQSVVRSFRNCDLCGNQDYKHWWKKDGYDIGECRHCKLVQVMQFLDDEHLASIYDSGYYEGKNDQVYQDYLANESAKRDWFRTRFNEIVETNGVTRPGNCLEVGCAYGLLLDEAQKLGWNVRGTEISEHAAAYARSRFGINVVTGREALAAIKPMSQDLVIMWDVIEHLTDPLATLHAVRRILAPNGLLNLSTGDIRSLGARLYGKRWYLVSPPYHLIYFDRNSITLMLRAAGFDVRGISSEGHPLENMNRNRFLQWIARHDRYAGWRFNSGPVMNVTATA